MSVEIERSEGPGFVRTRGLCVCKCARRRRAGGRGCFWRESEMAATSATSSSSGAAKEALMDRFRTLSETDQHDHVLSLLNLVEVATEPHQNLSLYLSRCSGSSAAQSLQPNTSAPIVRHTLPAARRAVCDGVLLPGRAAAGCQRPVLP